MRKTAPLFVPLMTLGLLACEDQPSDADYDEVAAGLAKLVSDGSGGGDLGSMEDGVSIALGDVPAGMTLAGSGEYETTRSGLRYEYAISCVNAAGRPMVVCDERTDSASLTLSWSGELVLDSFEGSVSRAGSWQIVGLQSDTAQLDGEGSFDVNAWWRSWGGESTYALDYDATYDAIEIDMASRTVVGGEARWVVDVQRTRDGRRSDAEASFTIIAELSFTDSGDVVITLDGTRTYRLDTARGTLVRE